MSAAPEDSAPAGAVFAPDGALRCQHCGERIERSEPLRAFLSVGWSAAALDREAAERHRDSLWCRMHGAINAAGRAGRVPITPWGLFPVVDPREPYRIGGDSTVALAARLGIACDRTPGGLYVVARADAENLLFARVEWARDRDASDLREGRVTAFELGAPITPADRDWLLHALAVVARIERTGEPWHLADAPDAIGETL